MLKTLENQPFWAVATGGVATAVLLTLLAYGGAVRPAHAQQQAARAQAQTADQRRGERHTAQQRFDQLADQLQQRRATLAEQPLHLGQRAQLNRQIAGLIELAQAHELEVVTLQPSPRLPGPYFDRVPMQLVAGGEFRQHLTFLEALHQTVPSVAVVGLDLESRFRDPQPRPTARYDLHWFTQLPPAPRPVAATSDPATASPPTSR